MAATRAILTARQFSNATRPAIPSVPHQPPLYLRPDTAVMERGEGCWLWDTIGRRYLDCTAGIAVMALGHSHPVVTAAIQAQAGRLIHTSNLFHHAYSGAFIDRLRATFPAEHPLAQAAVFLCNSGTEATEAAIKFARLYGDPGRRQGAASCAKRRWKILTFDGAFHGRTMGALAATPNEKYQRPFAPMLPGFSHVPLNDMAAVEQAVEQADGEMVAVLVEPIQGEGGVRGATGPFLRDLRRLCTRHDLLLIFDEIQCGLGRTGRMWAHCQPPTVTTNDGINVVPDMLTAAKPLAAGIPMGACLLAPHLLPTVRGGDHGTTFGGNALACAVATAVLHEIDRPQFLANVRQTADHLHAGLTAMMADPALAIKQVRSYGLMAGVELAESRVDAAQVVVEMRQRHGVLACTAGGNVVRLVPPLIIQPAEIDLCLSALRQSLAALVSSK